MQLESTSTPRSPNNSATCSYDSGYRRYQRTHKMITSPGCWRPLKGLFGGISIGLLPYQDVGPRRSQRNPLQSQPLSPFGSLVRLCRALVERDDPLACRLEYAPVVGCNS